MKVEKGEGWELRLGRYQDVLTDVQCDAVITDPPYSERTHTSSREDTYDSASRCGAVSSVYAHWRATDASALATDASALATGWVCVMTDHVLAPAYEATLADAGRYVFAPVPIVERGRNVRLQGDGPACWAIWLMVARPKVKPYSKWGALVGGYVTGREHKHVAGGKGLQLMRAIIRDYSKPGDLVCDPCAGGGTTLLAAVIEGRRAIGAEMDPHTFELAVKRLRGGYTPRLF